MTDYVYLIVGSMVTIICFYYIAAPFFERDRQDRVTRMESEPVLSIEYIYSAVNELEMDYLMKKISENDFNLMKHRYQIMAAELLKMEEEHVQIQTTNRAGIDQDILMELQKIRKQKGRHAG